MNRVHWLRRIAGAICVVLALSATASAAPSDRSDDDLDDLPRRKRCKIEPYHQGCITLGVGASIGVVGNDMRVGLGAGVGTFAYDRLHVGLDGGGSWKLTGSSLARYDMGLGVQYYIGPVANFLIVPGYRGGRFWQRSAVDLKGWIHGPRISLLAQISKRSFFGISFAYDFVHVDAAPNFRAWSLAPTLTVMF